MSCTELFKGRDVCALKVTASSCLGHARWLKAEEAGATEHLHTVMTGPNAAAVAQAIDAAWKPLQVQTHATCICLSPSCRSARCAWC